MGLILLVCWIFITILSVLFNRDIFSPAKIYLLSIFVYFASIFFEDYSLNIYLVYIFLLFFGLILVIFEYRHTNSIVNKDIRLNNSFSKFDNRKNYNKALVVIWLFTIIPIIAQLYLIYLMGGLQSYINNLGFRVVEWKGLGVILELIKMFGTINLIYFIFLLLFKKIGKRKWILYLVHFSLFVLVGLLSGSRGTLLWNFVFMIVIYHYLVKRVAFKTVLLLGIIIFMVASLLGVARNGYKLTDDGFRSGLDKQEEWTDLFSAKTFSYGTDPLVLTLSSENNNLQYGLTFITPLTNLVPRAIWPSKPDTGGVVLTKYYTGDAWGGYSNLSTGLIAEGIINFGKFWGIIVGFIILAILMFYLNKFYRVVSLNTEEVSLKKTLQVSIYSFIGFSFSGLLFAEWTDSILGLFFRIVKFMIIFLTILYTFPKPIDENTSSEVNKEEYVS